jgi:hypothetical protein
MKKLAFINLNFFIQKFALSKRSLVNKMKMNFSMNIKISYFPGLNKLLNLNAITMLESRTKSPKQGEL